MYYYSISQYPARHLHPCSSLTDCSLTPNLPNLSISSSFSSPSLYPPPQNASSDMPSSLDKRTEKLQRAIATNRPESLRGKIRREPQPNSSGHKSFEPAPPNGTTRLLVLGEILAAADYVADNLYVEFAMRYDPSHWSLDSEVSSLGWEQVRE